MRALVGPRWRWWIIALLCAWLLIGLARDASAQSLFADVNALSGSFTQELSNDQGQLIGSSSGTFALLRPHFFRWSIESPGQQLLLGDGNFFWQYDRDLETIIRRPLEEQLQSPLGVLLADGDVLMANYDVQRSESEILLRPTSDAPLFKQVTITLEGGLPGTLTLVDNLDQQVVLRLVLNDNNGLTGDDFSFTPPPGAELTIVSP